MQKFKYTLLAVVLILFAVLFTGTFVTSFVRIKSAGTFDVDEYQEAIQYYNDVIQFYSGEYPLYLPEFSNIKELCSSAQRFWFFTFGDCADSFIDNYEVYYDEVSQTYLVVGKLQKYNQFDHKNAYLIVNRLDYKIIACWADKE